MRESHAKRVRLGRCATGYTFTPCVGYFTSPDLDTRPKGPTDFSVSYKSKDTYKVGEMELPKLLYQNFRTHDSSIASPVF